MAQIPRIAFVTIGQSPRPDITPHLVNKLNIPIIADEFGALDDVEDIDAELLTTEPNQISFHTRFRNGDYRIVPASVVKQRTISLCARLDDENYDFIVLISTGLYSGIETKTPLLHAQTVVETWMQSLSMVDCRVGILHPIDWNGHDDRITHGTAIRQSVNYTMPGPSGNINDIAKGLKDCDLIVMHSMAYSGQVARRVSAQTGKPVVTARRILAGTLQMQLDSMADTRLRGQKELAIRMAQAYPQLTQRELEVAKNVVDGLSNKEIARKLDISHRTVEIHRGRVMKKLDASSVSSLIRQVLML
ncbi:MAG: hypothetical protein COB93_12205 [Sneathiella sp.]|nr:MAG: hypothetical protein COB93_12205 [Sneathiella sp.]